MLNEFLVGPTQNADGSNNVGRAGKTGEQIFSELHGRFYEQNSRGALFSIGQSITALSANTISLTSSTTPIVGVWNPSTSSVYLSILQAALTVVANNLTSGAGPGLFVWASSTG